jgi:selenocysteine lyase/cysteine desulfurase
MSTTVLDVNAVRARFSSLQGGFAFLDAPGGSQVPDEVGDAIARTLREASASRRSSTAHAPTRADFSAARPTT